MQKHWLTLGTVSLLATTSVVFPAPSSNHADFFIHEVAKGESLSFLCVLYYGHYRGVMTDAIVELNPSMAKASTIRAGQKIKLPHPKKTVESFGGTRPLFERRNNVTQGVITYTRGDSRLIPRNGSTPSRLSANTIVYPGDIIETGAGGLAEIIINSESVVRMRENTRLGIEAFRQKRKKGTRTEIRFDVGTIWVKVKQVRDRSNQFELELPTVMVTVLGTVYQTSLASDSTAEIIVYNGEVAVKNKMAPLVGSTSHEVVKAAKPKEGTVLHQVPLEDWVHIVRSMHRIKIEKNGKLDTPLKLQSKPSDSWKKWNIERDRHIARVFAEPL
ncbi:MAG: LysM peptidoglycan-binding domain-containing protein [Chitinivibrionales bacterium]|nr:LysM peptidoglycan-binding domain-containing protein [Chitinivibrionales bacterium]MBD3358547.1 LysM peptidoglycan-binding domain-containing protein [Chitinivibrionales bacterium]